MPLEIKELHIKASISDESENRDVRGNETSGNTEEIVAECVEKVMEILKEKLER
jgi:hypothetical protein